MSDTKTAQMIQGARSFGIELQTGDDDQLTYDASYEPSQGVLERIAEHKDAITALLKARQTAAAIAWDKLSDLSYDEYGVLAGSVKADLEALQDSLDKLERVGAAILPKMRDLACPWGEAVQSLLADPASLRYAHRRPKLCSDEEWLAALRRARLLEQRGPQSPRGVIR